jgi:endoglucanase
MDKPVTLPQRQGWLVHTQSISEKSMWRIAFLLVQLFAVAGWRSSDAAEMSMLHAQGSHWVNSDGKQVTLKGVNLGNWLMLEFWMMGQQTTAINDQCTLEATLDRRFGYAERERLLKLFRDNWITTRDWDMIASMGLNLVRLPFIWSLVEDEKNPGHVRPDAWHYLDDAIEQAQRRGLYVVLDLHGAVGSQGLEHHSGCADRNLYWRTPEYQERTAWLWEQVASRYKDRAAVAGYSLLNEPWGSTESEMAAVMKRLYARVRAIDSRHVIILPGHSAGIDAYGKPAEQGMHNVAFEMHFYPGHFGWGKPGRQVHREWLDCRAKGDGSCQWQARLIALDTPFFVGEFQPWADMDEELGGQITRVSFDTYASYGWAATIWSYKMVSNAGGQGAGNWGVVTNSAANPVAALDFASAPLADIKRLFGQFGSVPYAPHRGVMKWLGSAVPPHPFTPD